MKWRRLIACLVSVALVATQTSIRAQTSHDLGVAAGRAANATMRSQVNPTRAGEVLPGYGTPAPQTSLSGRPNVVSDANVLVAQCRLTPTAPNCRALLTAVDSANTPRTTYSIADPRIRDARGVMRNPGSATLGTLANYYSSCSVSSTTTPAGTELRTCNRYTGTGPFTCSNQLTVDVEKTPSCNPGEWFASSSSGSLALATQCLPGWNGVQQHFRLSDGGSVLSYFDVNMTLTSPTPQVVADWGQVYDAAGNLYSYKAYAADRSCNGTTCSLNVLIEEPRSECTGSPDSGYVCTTTPMWLPVYSACPAPTVSGDTLAYEECTGSGDSISCTAGTRDVATCYAPSASPTPIFSGTGFTGYQYWTVASTRAITGYTLNPAYGSPRTIALSYPQPTNTATVSQTWVNTCPSVSDGRCSVVTPLTCVDGPATKDVEGVPVTAACWKEDATMQCTGATTTDQCSQFASQGCTATGASVCTRNDPVTGACTAWRDTYSCPVAGGTAESVTGCPSDVFCVGTSCFNTRAMADGDFARSMSMLEGAREAGLYLDTDKMRVFSGTGGRCRDRLLTNCCDSDSAGRGMTNQSTMGLGTKLVFDVLYQGSKYVMQAIQGYLSSLGVLEPVAEGAASSTFSLSYYGVTASYTSSVAGVSTGTATGTAAGTAGEMAAAEAFSEATVASATTSESIVLYTYTTEAGGTFTLAFDPWSLVIAIVIAIILAALECDEQEALIAMREGAGLCHTVGSWCSSCLRILGVCVTCLTHSYGKCCFNSMLARIINQQGRVQVSKGWGSPQNLDCSGFTLDQLASLDFGAMDLTEFYASIIPNYTSCPVGTVAGDTLTWEECSGDPPMCMVAGRHHVATCYSPSATPTAIFSGNPVTGYQYWTPAGPRSNFDFEGSQVRAINSPTNCYYGQGRCQ